ncbi:islet cell autoantigen 1 [Ictalurus furcatus]|uniref:islet cell autoantigen 1 n=1 Tax=Ictalurus furcatus TaxID=66913 RepID=UPI00234FCB6B|nr:islet cell autoantigen 1 [Ictalurus furcatus]XP_053467591.1 islet cell autoantigen 1 [Ictalurus furcatus]
MDSGQYAYAREYFDRFVQSQDSSVVNKFQQRYWKTKQTLIKVTGKKEDEHVVASDADLDAKLEVFHSVQRTCMELLKVIEQYQRRICVLSQEENELGRFLRSQGSQDKSRAGKIMQATGKALCFSSQQRLALRVPLCRLYQEVETFRYRAISDTWLTVNRMEQARTEYRGALLWMKDISQELDPDTHKQMEKFRKVQAQVRLTKTGFDKLKNDVCQKVDLLGASRCNLLSYVLTNYQTTLLHFWEKTSHTMAAIHESFKGCQPHELSAQKENKGSDPGAKKRTKKKTKTKTEQEGPSPAVEDTLISLDDEDLNKDATQSGAGEEPPCGVGAQEKDALSALTEILSSSSVEDADFSREWRDVFGEDESVDGGTSAVTDAQPGKEDEEEESFFLPSQLLDQNLHNLQSAVSGWIMGNSQSCPGPSDQTAGANQITSKPTARDTSESVKDRFAWFNLFADLDPLTNPDAVGRTDKEHELFTA